MEVHHHTQTPRKKWTHYFWEFLMLFLAVFCGFLAENEREHMVEHNREKQYVASLISDLQNDTSNFVLGFPRKEGRIKAIDSVFLFFQNNPDATSINGTVYRQLMRTNYDITYWRHTTTIDQLKAGGMRLIRKKNVAESIAEYDRNWVHSEEYWLELYLIHQEKQKTSMSQLFEATDLLEASRTNPKPSEMLILDDSKTIRINRSFLNQFLNELSYQKRITSREVDAYRNLQKSAENLITLIKKEYRLK